MDEPTSPLPRRVPGATLHEHPNHQNHPGCPDNVPVEPPKPWDGAWAARHVTYLPVERLRAFSLEILRLHRPAPPTPGFIPMCACSLPARHCAIIRAEHELLDVTMPFTLTPTNPPW